MAELSHKIDESNIITEPKGEETHLDAEVAKHLYNICISIMHSILKISIKISKDLGMSEKA